jgi:hypothetical protein
MTKNKKVRTVVEQKIIDIIYDNIPINNFCSRCERELEVDWLLGNTDSEDWTNLASKISDVVKEHIQLALKEQA